MKLAYGLDELLPISPKNALERLDWDGAVVSSPWWLANTYNSFRQWRDEWAADLTSTSYVLHGI